MISWISKKNQDRKRQEEDEQKLRTSLAEKVSQYEKHLGIDTNDHTEIFIDGKKLRVPKEQITIRDV